MPQAPTLSSSNFFQYGVPDDIADINFNELMTDIILDYSKEKGYELDSESFSLLEKPFYALMHNASINYEVDGKCEIRMVFIPIGKQLMVMEGLVKEGVDKKILKDIESLFKSLKIKTAVELG